MKHLRAHQELPKAASQRLIDFEQCQIMSMSTFPPWFVLRVTGTRIPLEGQKEAFEILTIEATHPSGFRPRPAEGPQQLYKVLSLEGTASQAD
jgi:hypothetical protein